MGFFDFLKPSAEQKKNALQNTEVSALDQDRLDEAQDEIADNVTSAVMGDDSDSSDDGGMDFDD